MSWKIGDKARFVGKQEDWPYGDVEVTGLGFNIQGRSLIDSTKTGLFFPDELEKINELIIPLTITIDRPTSLFPEKAEDRKKMPVASGVIDYFPAALAEVSKVSYAGNEQHNPGEPLHWARNKSTDQADTIMRHFIERGTLDSDGLRHSAKLAWRALALLQLELEADGAPIARGAK